jgi:hypothetical protein
LSGQRPLQHMLKNAPDTFTYVEEIEADPRGQPD